ncbi:MAG: hypothetical protein JSW06_05490 [Thermoplasmatales archaeon]|nr:MAG: hypothetical protein JSW06_05490 [Thermoplasmatales archaeon]
MKNVLAIVVAFVLIACAAVFIIYEDKDKDTEDNIGQYLNIQGEKIIQRYTFSYPTFSDFEEYTCVYVDEADFYDMHDGWPAIPVKTTTYEFPFRTKILDVIYEYSEPEAITLTKKISVGSCSTATGEDPNIYDEDTRFPPNFISYHTGGGLSNGTQKTFLTVRVNPITYRPTDYEIDFIEQAKVTITFEQPDYPLLENKDEYDLLIITVSNFKRPLQRLVNHKENMGIKTKLVTLNEIQDTNGRDTQEKMKYYIKESIENWGIEYVLLVGGIKGQTTKWNLPTRYSHVLISEGKQEVPEPKFICDLYFADIYDSEGNFSCWDTNDNNIFAEWDGSKEIDKMDLYPDVYLGRLPCRNKREVRIVVDKIIDYEKKKADDDWFKKMILVSGDHWKDPGQISEGVLIMEEASEIMSGFTPIKLYATEGNKLLVRNINKAINKGAGFAYFCGHGSATSWGIHYPPDATGWGPSLSRLGLITFYHTMYMNFLRNKNKLPITVVGGCFNGKFDLSIGNSLKRGKIKLAPASCWAWKLTSKKGGGAIATIANTGLGTHAMSDADQNNINDYLEVLDGWLELRFFQLYNQEKVDILGDLHSGAIKDYLHTFLCSRDEMDPKMVQQWQLFGDPSLKVGG